MSSISIFNYEDPSLFLRDSWNKKRVYNKNFSLRAWARQLGMSSHGTFYHIVQGKRPLPKKYVKAISNSLDLSPKESMYLETLIDFSKAKTIEHKSYYRERLQDLAPGRKLNFYEIETFHFLKDPLNGAIIELTNLKGFKNDPLWIKDRLTIKASLNDIQNTIKRLLDLDLLKLDNKGNLVQSNSLLHTKQDIKNEALQEYHKNVLNLAAEQISEQEVNKREYNATAMGIKVKDIPRAKERVREFLSDFIREFEANYGQADEIFQLGIQYFGLTDKLKEKIQ
ncbi:MAG: TIGR02147 family protein [Bacteriovoracaceae bacterium]|jgi:uncharacterized protein (TIGR02147 family)|nr:TIGR02147 family protein [Bacteriovoracaceae bacterium]